MELIIFHARDMTKQLDKTEPVSLWQLVYGGCTAKLPSFAFFAFDAVSDTAHRMTMGHL